MAIRTIRKPEYERLLKLNAERITIGVHADDGAKLHPTSVEETEEGEEPQTVAEIAAAHELGIGVPRREWLTLGTQRILNDGVGVFKKLPLDFAPELARRCEAEITSLIKSGTIPPENAPLTKLKKGHGRTLIDTKTFVNSVHARVVPK